MTKKETKSYTIIDDGSHMTPAVLIALIVLVAVFVYVTT